MLWEDLTVTFQYPKWPCKKDGNRLFARASCDKTKGNGFKLEDGLFILDIRKKLFVLRMVKHWNRWYHREVVDVLSLRIIGQGSEKSGLVEMSLLIAEGLNKTTFNNPLQPKPLYESLTALLYF